MRWILRYRISSFLRSTLWLVPIASILLALLCIPLLRTIDQRTGWTLFGFGLEGTRPLLALLAGSLLSLLVFVLSSLLIAVQVASAQLTPRVIAATFLRPVSLAAWIGIDGIQVVQAVYPHRRGAAIDRRSSTLAVRPASAARTVLHTGPPAVLLAADFRWLSDAAIAAGGLIELVPRVGEFVADGEPLYRLHAGAARLEDDALRAALAFGRERTLEQDPMFAFRILVDIAAKALSPAINDPTTAVLSIDQIHRLLRWIGQRHLDTEAMLDPSGACGVAFRTPDWEDYVILAVSEIRQYGRGSFQVMRRLRAMLDNLLVSLPEDRHGPLEVQLRLLERSIQREFPDAEDRAAAAAADPQGVGHVE
jgi:uncharacterized membrane protein